MHSESIAPPARERNLTAASFLIVAFLTGIASALQTPTLSLFLTEEVHARPAMVGFFFTGSAVIGILVSQFLAGHSDRRGDRKTLILGCCLLGVLACLLFAWNRNYFILLFIGVFLSSFGSTANPQLFALAREHADNTGREVAMFSAILRAQVSLAWVIGPPISYALAMGFGFDVMYLSAGLAFVVCAGIVWWLLPSMPKTPQTTATRPQAPARHRRDALLLFVACTMMWGCNSLYIINMPLYIINELKLPEKLAGIMMGTAAGLEIPTMLIAGYYARRFGKRFLLRVAVVAGLLFYLGMLTLQNEICLLGLQLLNAIFIGILAGIGMLYFQDLMPGQAGSATTLYANTTRVGWIIAGSLAGISAEIWGYYAAFYIALAMIAVTVYCLMRIQDI
ncbi:sugar efflux transporter SetB [Shimwellia blattae]|uniref:Putative sugar efflux transporter B YeiOB n=1 Tax=Shimwellia blattae (strain ATCC 29907 / DSM 4481 / JCM 1650 / NBRC 105725 / CDC 9005-74) TaxID=630626 RepID=I2B7E6_SHIBC|nr:sugar efflux transporter SetB [Shimwellia blattae]AFJ46450.1 putative sugar efflux transporter B YeiOB [Shimwellia blattae DSM 4481 = NBRC 105725]GAB80031.1 sugar efflux transporter SetB [Shimwellia blattae DSM 4481 = NBRC 105725]VDY63918.1 Sugar efflux transporter B [Shimwellia blattae]VEC22054.1 Sugar efflux transporter B [Shimwellia blattae]